MLKKRERRDTRRFEESGIDRWSLEREGISAVYCGSASVSGALRLGSRRNNMDGDFKGLPPSPSRSVGEGGTRIEPKELEDAMLALSTSRSGCCSKSYMSCTARS